ncbi:MAG: aminoacyl-tRNA hydrolase [Bathelium mastoideum]|nr:MAG: aminoacyl-tRNA hydrolase [Bathelium mastoideum]
MPPVPRHPLLVASLGNPGPTYANTLHSAGHTLLLAVAQYLKYSPFSGCHDLGKGVALRPYPSSTDAGNTAADWVLWQSPSLMNTSGRPVSQAWKAWQGGALTPALQPKENAAETRTERGMLVLLHDELDVPLGQLKKRGAGVSARGHNGVKSVQKFLPKTPFTRIAVGIGRPLEGRKDPGIISQWVLRKMTREEKGRIEGQAKECVDMLTALARS